MIDYNNELHLSGAEYKVLKCPALGKKTCIHSSDATLRAGIVYHKTGVGKQDIKVLRKGGLVWGGEEVSPFYCREI